jgi:2'-5' RNA ligase
MENFFDTIVHRWPAGQADYHWHVLFPPGITRERLFEPYRDLTHRGGIEPVQPDWYHLTLLHSGPTGKISDSELSDIVELVRRGCAGIDPFEVTLDRPHIGGVAVECMARQGKRLRELWKVTVEATQQVTGDRFPVIPAQYYPHMSLGYGAGRAEDRPMKMWLSDQDDIEAVTLPVGHISLVAQSHDLRAITWKHILDVPLGR